MATLLALYKTPEDAAAFDRHYSQTHIPIAKKMPGLRSYNVSKGGVVAAGGPSSLHLVATLKFDSVAAIEAALSSPEGAAAAADLRNFAGAGVELFMYEDAQV